MPSGRPPLQKFRPKKLADTLIQFCQFALFDGKETSILGQQMPLRQRLNLKVGVQRKCVQSGFLRFFFLIRAYIRIKGCIQKQLSSGLRTVIDSLRNQCQTPQLNTGIRQF